MRVGEDRSTAHPIPFPFYHNGTCPAFQAPSRTVTTAYTFLWHPPEGQQPWHWDCQKGVAVPWDCRTAGLSPAPTAWWWLSDCRSETSSPTLLSCQRFQGFLAFMLSPTCSFLWFVLTLHWFCKKFGLPYLGKATTAARTVLPIPTSMCRMFMCLNNGIAVSVRDFQWVHRCWCMWL